MPKTIYQHMQAAVDLIPDSPHPTNKIAATLAGESWALSRTNHWPDAIEQHIGRETKIGNSSGTIHAEVACLLAAQKPTESASLFITDPPCPNCMKNIAEAGISALYIDHKGFKKDFARRRGDHFENMSMKIAEHAGISVYEIWRKEERTEIIFETPKGYVPPDENPVTIQETSDKLERLALEKTYGSEPWAAALTQDQNGQHFTLSAGIHPAVGYTSATLEPESGKYSFLMQPVNRLLMATARKGLKIMPGQLYSSRIPTSRELVNLVGAGLKKIQIGDTETARDEYGPIALNKLTEAEVLNADH